MRSFPLLPFIFTVCILLIGINFPRALADSTYTVTVTVQGLPTNLATALYVNGSYNGTLAGGASVTYNFSSTNNPYFISVDSYVQGSNNATRYYCQSSAWQANASATQVFTYVTEYFLTVQTAYSTASGQGWYTSGSTAHASVSDQEIPEGQGTRNIFSGWTGDAAGTQLTSNAITIDGPKVAVADWETQFFLTVQSDPENLTGLNGSGWYDAGTQANFSAALTMPQTSNTRLKFNYWSGEFSGHQPVGSVPMDRPKTVVANYLAQYLLAVQYSPAEVAGSYNETHAGWYDTNSDVQLGPAPTTINVSTVERLQFAGWSEGGTVSNNLSYILLMDKPRNVTLSYTTQYYLDVRSTYGTVSGSGWYSKGTTATISAATSFGAWPFSYTLTGWTVDPPTEALTNNGGAWTMVVDRPYVVEAQWGMDYFPLIIFFGGTAVAVTTMSVGAVVGYKRGIFSRRRGTHRPQKTEQILAAPGAVVTCSNCGNSVPKGVEFCDKCGALVPVTQEPSQEDRVYDYIVNHRGVISLRAASTDLGISVEQLTAITERLKREGRLS